MSSGIHLRPTETLLSERARDFLAGGPADSAALIGAICQLPGVPRGTAERLAAELLDGRPDFVRGDDGLWRVTGGPAAAPRARTPTWEEWLARRAAAVGEPSPPAAPASRAPRAKAAPRPVPVAAPGDDDPLDRLSYAVVDVETTGGSPHTGHRITEIAAVLVRDGRVCDVYETLVNPERTIPPEIMKLTGITMGMVRDKPPFRDVAADVVAALSGHVFVAHNVAFDWRFVTAEVQRARGETLDGRRLCTVRLARKLLPQLRSRSLGYVADHYGADRFAETYFENRHGGARHWRHSAAGDAVATAHCLLRLFEDATDHGVRCWGELDQFLSGGSGKGRRRRAGAMPAPVDRDTTA